MLEEHDLTIAIPFDHGDAPNVRVGNRVQVTGMLEQITVPIKQTEQVQKKVDATLDAWRAADRTATRKGSTPAPEPTSEAHADDPPAPQATYARGKELAKLTQMTVQRVLAGAVTL